jgi:hypothetical protein
VEPTVDAPPPPPAVENREASLHQAAEAAVAPVSVPEAGATEAVVEEVGSSPPHPVAADAEDVETRAGRAGHRRPRASRPRDDDRSLIPGDPGG